MVDSIDQRLSNRLLSATLILQAAALVAMIWLRPPTGLYLQFLVVAVGIAGVVVRYRVGMRAYRRLKAHSASRESELRQLLDRDSQ